MQHFVQHLLQKNFGDIFRGENYQKVLGNVEQGLIIKNACSRCSLV